MADLHLWLKAGHLTAMVAWMAGLFYLPRLFVYHAEQARPGSELSETLKVMERRLLRAIMNPAMIATWIFGLSLLWSLGAAYVAEAGWLHAKLALVVLLTIYHHLLGRWRKDFEADANTRSGRFYRIWNEAPTLLLIAIVVLAVVKPF